MTRFAFYQRHFFSLLWYMICIADGSPYVLKGQRGAETFRKIKEMRLAEGKELDDWREYCYIDILKYETPWRIRAKVAGLQQAVSQSVTWIPLSEALDNMLLYIEDQKREKETQNPEPFTLLLSRMPSNLRFLHPSRWRNQGTQYVFVRHRVAVREALRTP